MKKYSGFSLIELVIFIIITGILAKGILLSMSAVSSNSPTSLQNIIATQAAQQCIEWFIGQENLNGYSSITCNSTTPAFCTAPSGYTVSSSCSTTTISGDSNYETITVTVTGAGNATLTYVMASH